MDYSGMFQEIDETIEEIVGMNDEALAAEFERCLGQQDDPDDRYGRGRFRLRALFGEIERRRIAPELEAKSYQELQAELEQVGGQLIRSGEDGTPDMSAEARFSALGAEIDRRMVKGERPF